MQIVPEQANRSIIQILENLNGVFPLAPLPDKKDKTKSRLTISKPQKTNTIRTYKHFTDPNLKWKRKIKKKMN